MIILRLTEVLERTEQDVYLFSAYQRNLLVNEYKNRFNLVEYENCFCKQKAGVNYEVTRNE